MNKSNAYWTVAGAIPATFGGAMAADIPARSAPIPVGPVPMMVSWSGLYAGVNAGFISHQARFTGALPAAFNNNYAWPSTKTTATGGIFGAQLGYNFQSGQLVYGVEADINFVAANSTAIVQPGGYAWRQRASLDALGTARVRLGYAFDRALIYATGGLAIANVRDAIQAGPPLPAYNWSRGSSWKVGYVVGAGIEYALTNRWSAKLEGLYYDLGRQSHISAATNNGVTYGWGARSRSDGFIARIGLNYKFGGGADPVIAKY